MDFDEVANELYSLPGGQFTAARDHAVRQAKAAKQSGLAREVAALRRPTAAAWAVNQLTRHHRDQFQALLDLGQTLRRAQAGVDADTLRQLLAQRHQVLDQLTGLAARTAERADTPLSVKVREEVEQTLAAAIADQQAADQVAAGRLTTALPPPTALPGLAPNLRAIPTRTPTQPPPPPSPRPPGRTAPQSAHRDRPDAAHEQRAHEQRLEALRADRDDLLAEATAAARVASDAEHALQPLADQVAEAGREAERAETVLEQARFALRRAQADEREARTRLPKLRRQAEQARQQAEQASARLAAEEQQPQERP